MIKVCPPSSDVAYAAGLLVPDIPLEETGPVRQVATAAGLELVLLTTPTTPPERMEAIANVSQGFVYLVSVTGTPSLSTTDASALPRIQDIEYSCSFTADRPPPGHAAGMRRAPLSTAGLTSGCKLRRSDRAAGVHGVES